MLEGRNAGVVDDPANGEKICSVELNQCLQAMSATWPPQGELAGDLAASERTRLPFSEFPLQDYEQQDVRLDKQDIGHS